MRVNPDRREALLSALLLAFAALLAYGVMAARLGFYRDDWYLIWTAQTRGAEGLTGIFSIDRPFDGWVYIFDFWLAGVSPLRWQLYALTLKILSALAFLWLLRSLWAERKIETTLIALLFLVYPGFFQQPNALTFKQLLLSVGLALASLALTVNAAQSNRAPVKMLLTALAIFASAVYLLIYEALAGYEAVRVFLLVYLFLRQKRGWKNALRAALWNAAPYFLFVFSFLYWRLFLFEAKRKATDVGGAFSAFLSPHGWTARTAEYLKDLTETTFLAWATPLYQFWNQVPYRELGEALGLALALLLLTGGYFLLTRKDFPVEENAADDSARDWMILGALFVALTTLPVVAAGRNALFSVQWDRYTYQSAFGVALLLGGVAFRAVKSKARWALLAFLLLSGTMTQVFSAGYYRAFWKIQREAWRQLTWRAPQIEPGANLVLALPYALAEEYEAWGPANLIYYPQSPEPILSGQIPFDGVWADLARSGLEERVVRGVIPVKRDYGKTLVLSQPSASSCLHVLDSRRPAQSAAERMEIAALAPYSRTDLIQTSAPPAVPPREIFGDEPPHGWCYYYQKMSLARQTEDWQTAAALAKQAADLGLEPNDFSEWLPALEAYLRLGDSKNAKRLVTLIRSDETLFRRLCARYKETGGASVEREDAAVFESLCVR